MRYPEVTVVLAVKNEARFLNDALGDLLNQTYQNTSIIAFNDGSNDETPEILKRYEEKIKIFHHETGRGQSYCINRAIELSDAPYLAIADADDRYRPEKLSRQIAFLEKNPGIGACGCQLNTIPTGLHWNLPTLNSHISARLLLNMPMAHPSIVYRKSVIQNLRYNEQFEQAKDYNFIAQLRHKTQFHNLAFRGLQYRLNKGDETTLTIRKNNANKIRTAILNEDFGISDPYFIGLHNKLCNLETGAQPSDFKIWTETLSTQNRHYQNDALMQELYNQLWQYAVKFRFGKKEKLELLFSSGFSLVNKTKEFVKLLQ